MFAARIVPGCEARSRRSVQSQMHPTRRTRTLRLEAVRVARRSAWLGLVVAASALAGCAGAAALVSRGASRLEVGRGVVQAHTLPGDQLLAGPVLVDHRAVWVEGGRRLLVRSLDASGRTRTVLATSATPGAPTGTPWPFSVKSIAAGDGLVAFVESVIPCASAPPGTLRCAPTTVGPSVDSVTLFAGPVGGPIRPVESLVPPGPRKACQAQPEPYAVAIADVGLVDYEVSAWPCADAVSRLVLRSFSGQLVRVLARGLPVTAPFVAAGDWTALIRESDLGSKPDQLQIVRVSTGQTVLRLRPPCLARIGAVALDSSGRFALITDNHRSGSCHRADGFLRVGQIGNSRVRTLVTDVNEALPTTSIAIAGGRVAYGQRATGRSPTGTQVVIAAPGAAPTPIPDMTFGPLAFDGRTVATAHDDTVQLAAVSDR